MARMSESKFFCTLCGRRGIPIARIRGKEREAGHLKKIYCMSCRTETNHAECKPFTSYDEEDFQLEFSMGNFDKDGNRIKTFGEVKQDYYKSEV